MTDTVFTIGHSNYPIEKLMELIVQHSIGAVADVRTQPYSRMNPQFNRESLKAELQKNSVQYVYLGKELGARPDDPHCYAKGKVSYEKLGRSRLFEEGIERVKKGAKQYKLALLCAEKDPLQCHRSILIARHLRQAGLLVAHILEDGSIESQEQSIERLKAEVGLGDKDFFSMSSDTEDAAYQAQEERIAFRVKKSSEGQQEEH